MSWFQDLTRCYHPGGKQHRFEPRYSERIRGTSCKVEGHMTADDMHRLTTLKVYVCDICIWCGKISRSASLPEEAIRAKDPSDPVRVSDPSDPTRAQNPSDSPAR